MSRADNYREFTIATLSEHTGLSEATVAQSENLAQLDIDSLDIVEIMMRFEDKYDIDIDEADSERLKTVDDIVAYLERRNA